MTPLPSSAICNSCVVGEEHRTGIRGGGDSNGWGGPEAGWRGAEGVGPRRSLHLLPSRSHFHSLAMRGRGEGGGGEALFLVFCLETRKVLALSPPPPPPRPVVGLWWEPFGKMKNTICAPRSSTGVPRRRGMKNKCAREVLYVHGPSKYRFFERGFLPCSASIFHPRILMQRRSPARAAVGAGPAV